MISVILTQNIWKYLQQLSSLKRKLLDIDVGLKLAGERARSSPSEKS
jgi:hypothetical protein